MHLLLGIAPSQWPVAELCQFENLFFEDLLSVTSLVRLLA
jgi:hypothetical protein